MRLGCIIVLITGVLLLTFVGLIIVPMMIYGFDYSSAYLASLVNKNIRTPEIKRNHFTSIVEEIIVNDPNKWKNIECIPSPHDKINFPPPEGFKYVSKDSQERVHCLRVRSQWGQYAAAKCIGFGCPYTILFKAEQPMLLRVNNYVLRETKILAKIIDIASRPCDYIQEYNSTYLSDSSEGHISNMQRSFLCNHRTSEKPYVILDIINEAGKSDVRLLIERKDNIEAK